MEESGNGDRRETSTRRRAVSGGLLRIHNEKNKKQRVADDEAMRLPFSSPSVPASPTSPARPTSSPTNAAASPKSSGRKRALSGNLLSKLNFLRNTGDDGKLGSREQRPVSRDTERSSPTKSFFSRKSVEDDVPPISPESPTKIEKEKESALAAALNQSKTRKRKDSLRKTALLGGKRVVTEGREKKGGFGLLQKHPLAKPLQQEAEREQEPMKVSSEDETRSLESADAPLAVKTNFNYENISAASSSDSGLSEPAAVSAARLSLLTDHRNQAPSGSRTTVDELGSPLDIKSPTSQTSYTSTTDDDDILTFDRPAKSFTSLQSGIGASLTASLSSASTAYFPSSPAVTRPRSIKRASPLSRSIPLSSISPTDPEPHDYTETASWGYVILIATWVTFVVGMGSCLDIWVWAWDVGETPYAPPELENDESLPIVGYYPALIVLSGVVAWCWITVAWVGMKYFRHAKIEV